MVMHIARPAVSEQRLSLTPAGKVRHELKTPFRNGTTHVIFEPLDFLATLAVLADRESDNNTDLSTGCIAGSSTAVLWSVRSSSGCRFCSPGPCSFPL